MGQFRLTLLGTFAFTASAPCAMPGKKAQALLALLAMPAGQAHRRDKLATMLWSRLPEESARQNLRQCLTAIRRGCKFNGAVPVVAEDGLLRLDTERVVVDASEFEEAVRCRVGEELIDKVARTRQGEAVPENTTVRIEEVLGETVIVTRQ